MYIKHITAQTGHNPTGSRYGIRNIMKFQIYKDLASQIVDLLNYIWKYMMNILGKTCFFAILEIDGIIIQRVVAKSS